MFATFDAKDVSALAAFITDDVRLRLGNAEPVQGKSAFVEAVSAFLASAAGFRHEVLNVWSDGVRVVSGVPTPSLGPVKRRCPESSGLFSPTVS